MLKNILILMRNIIQEEPQCMVFEHMAYGDLHEFLISHSPKSDCSIDSDMDMRVLTQAEMAFISIQIAAGTLLKSIVTLMNELFTSLP